MISATHVVRADDIQNVLENRSASQREYYLRLKQLGPDATAAQKKALEQEVLAPAQQATVQEMQKGWNREEKAAWGVAKEVIKELSALPDEVAAKAEPKADADIPVAGKKSNKKKPVKEEDEETAPEIMEPPSSPSSGELIFSRRKPRPRGSPSPEPAEPPVLQLPPAGGQGRELIFTPKAKK